MGFIFQNNAYFGNTHSNSDGINITHQSRLVLPRH
jgi:hypothetical protein